MNKICGIYKIENIINGDIYIGSSIDVLRRWRQHIATLRLGKGSKILQNAWNKYGSINFKFEQLCTVLDARYQFEVEDYFIMLYAQNNGMPNYNSCPNSGPSGLYKFDEKRRQRMSKSKIGKKLCPEVKELCSKILHNEAEKRKIQVDCVDKNGLILKTYNSLKDVAIDGFRPTGVQKVLSGLCQTHKNLYCLICLLLLTKKRAQLMN
jgi:group I intron endonuclease